jgi:hypothetical protein
MKKPISCFFSSGFGSSRSNWKAYRSNLFVFQKSYPGGILEAAPNNRWELSQSLPQYDDGIMSFHDILVGILIALAITLFPSVLQAILRLTTMSDENTMDGESVNNTSSVFGAESWNDISKPDNYILYTTKIRNRLKASDGNGFLRIEKKGTLWAMLLLFTPIFSFELFLALSRQFLCGGDPSSLFGWQMVLCSPHVEVL